MTVVADRTDVLPAPPPVERPESDGARWGLRAVVLAGLLLVLLVSLGAIAETVLRAETERTVAAGVRSSLALPDSERVQVDIAGSVLLQELGGGVDNATITVYSLPTGPANADLTVFIEGVRPDGDGWTADRAAGAVTLSAAQATALMVPAEYQGVMRVGFSGGDMVMTGSAPGGTTAVSVSVSMTPRFEKERLGATFSSVTIGDKTLSVDEVAAQTGVDLAALQPAPVCVAELLPRFLHVRDVRVADQRLRLEYDADLAASDTAEGREPGSCP
ncbi:LmeA family phospholipid-binding protein [Microbacterium sp. RURRCA19A]|uniref:LmeA family phospholipid-binding protein n=1 Tax=Microbacterium sp. RURRCA19A TaxID=1907391 RepID=UPI0009550898|nr:LmeA family phospholipid-binding protein [Microbacterium sp. RURRCA19A]SIS14977.1 hypothetical protein SAMN05880568_3109 [Microbacterium sp. RURRCA19A]